MTTWLPPLNDEIAKGFCDSCARIDTQKSGWMEYFYLLMWTTIHLGDRICGGSILIVLLGHKARGSTPSSVTALRIANTLNLDRGTAVERSEFPHLLKSVSVGH